VGFDRKELPKPGKAPRVGNINREVKYFLNVLGSVGGKELGKKE